jgi:glycosyl transferase family 25
MSDTPNSSPDALVQTNLSIRVINLSSEGERLQTTANLLAKANLTWSRLDAVDGRKADLQTHPLNNPGRQKYLFGKPLTNGEIGCFLSHFQALKEFSTAPEPFLLILEDDADIPANLSPLLDDLIAWAQAHPEHPTDCISLCNTTPKKTRRLADLGENALMRSWYFPILATACLWSKTGAAGFVRHVEQNGIEGAVDDRMRAWLAASGGGMFVTPAVVPPRPGKSSIDAVAPRSQHGGLPRWQKFWRKKLPDYVNALRHMTLNPRR